MSRLKYPLVCFDLDGTLVDDTVFIWKTLHDSFCTDAAARRKAHDDFFAGRSTYKEWFDHDLKLLDEAGATKERIMEVVSALKPMEGAVEILDWLKGRGHKLAIVSGSLDIVVEYIFGQGIFDHMLINRIRFDGRGRISGGDATPYDIEAKADGLRMLAGMERIPLSATAFVGDNGNDAWIARAAGFAIAFNCKSDELRRACAAEIREKDLRALKPLFE